MSFCKWGVGSHHNILLSLPPSSQQSYNFQNSQWCKNWPWTHCSLKTKDYAIIITFPLLQNFGFPDVNSCLKFSFADGLCDHNRWSTSPISFFPGDLTLVPSSFLLQPNMEAPAQLSCWGFLRPTMDYLCPRSNTLCLMKKKKREPYAPVSSDYYYSALPDWEFVRAQNSRLEVIFPSRLSPSCHCYCWELWCQPDSLFFFCKL